MDRLKTYPFSILGYFFIDFNIKIPYSKIRLYLVKNRTLNLYIGEDITMASKNYITHSAIKEVSQVLKIPVIFVRPFEDQPRDVFDKEELVNLADSIEEIGQQTPIIVRPFKGSSLYKFELIDGERRLMACQMIHLKYILAFVREVGEKEEQFIQSVAVNFCREGHRPIETAHALKRMFDYFMRDSKNKTAAIKKIGKICGKSVTWVNQHLGFLKLSVRVQRAIQTGEIPFQVGISLMNLKESAQNQFLEHILKEGYNYKKALNYIDSNRNRSILAPGSRMPRPSKDYQYLNRLVSRIIDDSGRVVDMPIDRYEEIFLNRSESDLIKTIENIKGCINVLAVIQSNLEHVKEEGKKSLKKQTPKEKVSENELVAA